MQNFLISSLYTGGEEQFESEAKVVCTDGTGQDG